MTYDICPACDGSGYRNKFSGEKCYNCNGLGVLEDSDPDDEEYEDYVSDEEEYEDYVSDEERKRNDAMERGDYLRDRAKDEKHG